MPKSFKRVGEIKISIIMKKIELYQMEKLEGGKINWLNTIGCAAGIAMVVASAGVNIFAFAAGVIAIDAYCGGVYKQ